MNPLQKQVTTLMEISERHFLDVSPRTDVFVAGSGRSGTTWLLELINHRHDHRVLFEPFLGTVIEACHHFHRRQYIRDTEQSPQFLGPARAIMSGCVRHKWVDKYNDRLIYTRRLIKDVRAHLLLHWLHLNFPETPIVFLLRHPCAVIASQLKKQWRLNAADFLKQPDLVADYLAPFVDVIHSARDQFDHMALVWCVENSIVLKQFRPGELLVVFYEDLVQYPEREVERLFGFLGRAVEPGAWEQLRRPSRQARAWSAIRTGEDLLNAWRAHVTTAQLRRTLEYLRLFGLDRVYGEGTMPRSEESRESRESGESKEHTELSQHQTRNSLD